MKKIVISLIALFLFAGPGCNYIDTDLNIDPSNPSDAPPNLLLPAAELQVAYILGGDYGRFCSVWTQHHAGIDRQQAGFDKYLIGESDLDNAWNSMYASAMQTLNDIVSKTSAESPYYSGTARVLMAYCLGNTTDMFGDVPFSEAFNGSDGNFTPKYDSQEQVYAAIIGLLDQAVTDLSAASSALKPAGDDLIYGGSTASWIKAANALKARYELHKSARNGASAFSAALAAIDAGAMEANGDDMEFAFTGGAQANPWYQFLTQRQGDLAMGGFFIDLLKNNNDPRLPVLATTNDAGEYVGSYAGQALSASETSDPTAALTGDTAPVLFMTYAETKFIEAEAALQTGNTARAQTAFEAAVTANLAKLGVDDPDFVAAATADLSLNNILTQKYIALYTNPESYVDFRRTGIPNLPVAIGAAGPNIPVRFPYAQSEEQLNSANVPSINIFSDKVWWDAN